MEAVGALKKENMGDGILTQMFYFILCLQICF